MYTHSDTHNRTHTVGHNHEQNNLNLCGKELLSQIYTSERILNHCRSTIHSHTALFHEYTILGDAPKHFRSTHDKIVLDDEPLFFYYYFF